MGATDAVTGERSDLSSNWHPCDDVDENQWNNVVTQAPHGTIYHRHEWIRAVETGFDYEPRHVVVEKRGNPIAIMPNFVVDLPLPDKITGPLSDLQPFRMVVSSTPGYGGPVTVTDERDSLDLAFETLDRSAGRRDVFHRLQSPHVEYIRYGQYLQTKGYEPSFDTCLFFIDLSDGWDRILENMDKERRKDVRSAHEQDYRVEVQPLREDLEPTYASYVQNTERVDGNLLPRAFVDAVAERLGDRIQVLTAFVEGEEVGRYVHLLDDEASVLRHWLSAIPDQANYAYHPSELLHAHAIQWGIERGYGEYEFGPSGAHFGNSIFRFKKKYGGTPVPVFTMEKGYAPVRWSVYKFGRRKFVEQTI